MAGVTRWSAAVLASAAAGGDGEWDAAGWLESCAGAPTRDQVKGHRGRNLRADVCSGDQVHPVDGYGTPTMIRCIPSTCSAVCRVDQAHLITTCHLHGVDTTHLIMGYGPARPADHAARAPRRGRGRAARAGTPERRTGPGGVDLPTVSNGQRLPAGDGGRRGDQLLCADQHGLPAATGFALIHRREPSGAPGRGARGRR